MTLPATCRLMMLGLVLATTALDHHPASAQDARAAITVLGGGSMYDDLTPGMTPTVLRSGWVLGLQGETWLFGGRTGLRINGQYEERSPESLNAVYAVAMGDVDLMVRILSVWRDRGFAPYIVLGGGASTFFSRDPAAPLGSGFYGSDPVTRIHALAGLGVDVVSWRRAGLRFEIGDRIVFPSIGESPDVDGLPTVHNPVAMAGLQLRFGSLSGRDAVRPAPRAAAPRGPAAPADTPPARPAEENRDAGADENAEAAGGGGRAEAPAPSTTPAADTTPASRPGAAESDAERAADARGRGPGTPAGPPEDRPRFTVQLGSFVETATATRWAERLSERGLPVWLLRLQIQGEGVRRIRVGAAMTEGDAGRLAEALRVEFGWSTRVDRIGDGEDVPPGALGRTRAYLTGRRGEGRP
jgi:cell division septation protein DedD